MALESAITRAILSYLNDLPECIAEKVQGSSSASGRADINGCYKGRSFRIEVKTPDHKNKESPKQQALLNKWIRAGSAVAVVYSLTSVLYMIDRLDKGIAGKFEIQEANGCFSWIRIPILPSKK